MDATERPVSPPPSGALALWMGLAVVAAGAVLWLAVVGPPDRSPLGTFGRAIGRELPYFMLDPLTGDARSVAKHDLEGHVTLVNYWGTWCPPCVDEFPQMAKLAKEFAADDAFRIYLVSCGQGPDSDLPRLRQVTQDFLDAGGYSLPTYVDQNQGARRAMQMAFDWEQAYPTTLVFDRKGLVRGAWIGYQPGNENEMRALIRKLLAEKQG